MAPDPLTPAGTESRRPGPVVQGPTAAIILLATGRSGPLDQACRSLHPIVVEHHLRLVIVWPGEKGPTGLGPSIDAIELVLVSPECRPEAARRAGAHQADADLLMFIDEADALAAGWADIVALRLGLIRRGSPDERGDNWASILSAQGVPSSAGGY